MRLKPHLHHMIVVAIRSMWLSEPFADFIRQELSGYGLNYILAVWEASGAVRYRDRELQQLNSELITADRCSFLGELLDCDVSQRTLRLLQRSPTDQVTINTFQEICEISASPRRYQAFAELPNLPPSRFMCELLEVLPEWLWSRSLISSLMEACDVYNSFSENIEFVLPPLVLHAEGELRERVICSLRDCRSSKELESRLYRLTRQVERNYIFEPPPFAGSERIFPLTTGEELHIEGRRMRNCVADYVENMHSMQRGKRYFYHYVGPVGSGDHSWAAATVDLCKKEDGYWYLHHWLGWKNRNLDDQKTAAMIEEFRSALAVESVDAPLASRSLALLTAGITGAGYYDYRQLREQIRPDHIFRLCREPENEHDEKAVAIWYDEEHKLGYIPSSQNRRISMLLDQGVEVRARPVEELIEKKMKWQVRYLIEPGADEVG